MQTSVRKVDFLVVGAEKSGTTWMADMLRQHPQVFIPLQKELHYFNRQFGEFPDLHNYNFDKPESWYASFFQDARPDQVVGEICPAYLWDDSAAGRIYSYNPNVRIVILLRDPVERTYSSFRFYIQRGVVRPPFADAIARHKALLVERSLYFAQVKRYLDRFPRQNVQVLFYDDLKNNEAAFLKGLESFLQVEEFLPPNLHEKSYVTGMPRHLWLNVTLARLRYVAHKYRLTALLDMGRASGLSNSLEDLRQKNKSSEKQTNLDVLSPAELQSLREYFRPDVEKLEALVARDLSAWKPQKV